MPNDGPKEECKNVSNNTTMPNGDPKHEYRDVSDNMRHYANMRFAQLTLYFALSAGLVSAVFLSNAPLDSFARRLFMAIGVVEALAFGLMEERAADFWHHLQRRAIRLEKKLGYRQYRGWPSGAFLTATNAARLLIWGGALLWLLAFVCAK